MAFDPDKILEAATNSAIAAVGGNIPNVGDYLQQVLTSHAERLKLILGFYAKGLIDDEDLKEKLEQEETTYRLQLDSSEFQDKALLQIGLNAFINGLYSAILSAVKL